MKHDQRWREVQAPEADWGREPERTRQLAPTLGEFVAAVLRLLQDPAGPRQERKTVLGQRHLAGGALGEPSTQLALEIREAFAHDRLWDSKATRRGAD